MLAHAALDDLGDVLERRAVLLLLVVAQPDGVRDLRRETHRVHRLLESHPRLLVEGGVGARLRRLLVQDARVVDRRVRLVLRALTKEITHDTPLSSQTQLNSRYTHPPT